MPSDSSISLSIAIFLFSKRFFPFAKYNEIALLNALLNGFHLGRELREEKLIFFKSTEWWFSYYSEMFGLRYCCGTVCLGLLVRSIRR